MFLFPLFHLLLWPLKNKRMIMSESKVICVTGIDTDIGKTIATGLLGKYLFDKGFAVITQKISQTGCQGISEDILAHRKIMGMDLLQEDRQGITCPYIFPEPCSPHLAASLVGETIDLSVIKAATEKLKQTFEYILLEGVGGLLVPLHDNVTLLDYLEEQRYPLILVSSSRLGSINHTLAALELAQKRNLDVVAILYNRYLDANEVIADDSYTIFSKYMKRYGFKERVIDLHGLDEYQSKLKELKFGEIFENMKGIGS